MAYDINNNYMTRCAECSDDLYPEDALTLHGDLVCVECFEEDAENGHLDLLP